MYWQVTYRAFLREWIVWTNLVGSGYSQKFTVIHKNLQLFSKFEPLSQLFPIILSAGFATIKNQLPSSETTTSLLSFFASKGASLA